MNEIKICKDCGGDGFVITKESDHSQMPKAVTCDSCNRTGRVILRTYTLEMPFGMDEKFNKVDSEIIEILNKWKK